jgi:iron complex transport system permease protein
LARCSARPASTSWPGGTASSGYRFILIGIGVSEFLLSIVAYLIARSDLYDAREAMTWLIGSVGQAGPGELRILLVAVVLLTPVALALDRPLRTLELGDDAATALGARVELVRLALVAVSLVLVAFATAVAGPLMFVALVAGPIAWRLLGPVPGGLAAAALAGAIIVLAADLVVQHALPVALPTGVVTGAVGAPYLVWLLITVNREGRGG